MRVFARRMFPELLLLIALACVPLVTQQTYVLHVVVMIFLFAVMGIAWNFIGGYAAQLSLGHAAFVAIGAYTTTILMKSYNITPMVGAAAGTVLAGAAAVLIGYPCFRLRGPYFALSTIAFAEILRILLLHFAGYTGGAEGIPIPFKGQDVWMLQFYSKVPYYYICLAFVVIVFLIARRVEGSKLGYYLSAIREDQDAAESIGIRSYRAKLKALLISAAITSVAGSLYAVVIGYIDPYSVAGTTMSNEIALIAIVGGIGTLWGPVMGATAVIFLTEVTNALLGSTRGGASMVIYGLLLIVIVLARPGGLISLFSASWPFSRRMDSPKGVAAAQ